MAIKKIFVLMVALLVLLSCDSSKTKTQDTSQDQIRLHKATVDEVIPTTIYTYLRVTEEQKEYWVAISKLEINSGEEFFYMDDVVTQMTNFHSQELNRDFPSILLISQISKSENKITGNQPESTHQTIIMQQQKMSAKAHSGRVLPAKVNVNIEPVKGGLSIAELYANKTKYSGKKVKTRGTVVKVNSQIMGRNWVHIQDGTKHNDDYDLTCTTNATVSVGDIITLQGTITLDKDFTSGYFYPVIMEEAIVVE